MMHDCMTKSDGTKGSNSKAAAAVVVVAAKKRVSHPDYYDLPQTDYSVDGVLAALNLTSFSVFPLSKFSPRVGCTFRKRNFIRDSIAQLGWRSVSTRVPSS